MTPTLPQTVTLARNEAEPESLELVAKAILDIDEALKQLLKTRANGRLIELLLYDMTKVPRKDIRLILAAAPKIAETYLRKA